jgi:endonuclease YncB( thermonuclease family)
MTFFDHDYKRFPELTDAELNTIGFSSPHPQITEDFSAVVEKVHDGDTYTVRTDFRDFPFPVRLLAVDTKELGEGGEASKEWVKALIEGQKVDIKINRFNRVGKYGRLLGDVFFNGLSIKDELLQKGLAVPFDQRTAGKIPSINKELNIQKWF